MTADSSAAPRCLTGQILHGAAAALLAAFPDGDAERNLLAEQHASWQEAQQCSARYTPPDKTEYTRDAVAALLEAFRDGDAEPFMLAEQCP